jgi:glyoxylate reductase
MEMKRLNVFVTRRIPDAGLALLKKDKRLKVRLFAKDRRITRKELLIGVKGCHAILSLLTEKIDTELMDAAGPQLKIVANYAVGYDNIDVAAAKQRGIKVANTPGVLTEAVAEHALALMMAVGRRIPESDRFVRAGKYKAWEPMLLVGTQFAGKTVGILGLGRIGSELAKMCAFGMHMKVMYYDIRRDEAFEKEVGATFHTVDELLAGSDFVSIHVPLLPTTRHLVDAKALRKMRKGACLVNTSRGPVVDEKALVAALKAKRIAGAALDVFEDEPKLAPGLAKLDNVVLTPHTASATFEARGDMAVLAAQAIIDVLSGKTPKNLVK